MTATNDISGLVVQSIDFSSGGFAIGGNAITLAANAVVIDTSTASNAISCNLALAGDVSVRVSGSIYGTQGLTLSGAISGSGGVTLRGGGHLIYSGSQPNTYSGLTRVLYGELQLKKPANVTAIAGDVDVEDDGVNYEYGYLSTFSDEQIADTAHVTIGRLATFGVGATETLGPVTLTRGATLWTSTVWSGNIPLTGTIVFAGDIEVTGTDQRDIFTDGTFALQRIRTINVSPGYGVYRSYGEMKAKTPGSGIVVTGGTYSNGTPSDSIGFTHATYDGPTTIKGGNVSLDAPHSAVDLQGGRFSGHCASLQAEAGEVNLRSYLGGVISDGDVRLGTAVTVGHDVGAAMKMNGTLDLGGATLTLANGQDFKYGTVYNLITNASSKPVAGTFANLPEGSMIANRWKISYVGGDGNDVTLTDFGLIPPRVSLDVASHTVPVGTPVDLTANVTVSGQTPSGSVMFLSGSNVLGTATLAAGVAKITVSALPRGTYPLTASYSGDSRIAPGTAGTSVDVTALVPTITSIDPPAVPGGATTTLTIHGTNFVDFSYVIVDYSGRATTFVSSTELRYDYAAPSYESDVQVDVWVSQPPPSGPDSAHYKLTVTAVKKPPSPFTFTNTQATVTGITPGAATLWAAVARAGNVMSSINSVATDSDNDGSVTLPFPYKADMPPYGVWTVADLSAHTIVADNPTRTAHMKSPFPSKMFLRDSNGNYSHIQFSGTGHDLFTFTWARPGAGAWTFFVAYGGTLDEDGEPNHRLTFETSMMRPVDTPSGPPPAGIAPGDMFVVIDVYGDTWYGDLVDGHLSESAGAGRIGFAVPSSSTKENAGNAKILVERTEGTDGTVSVQYATADDTAIAGKNYVAQAGTVTFGPGEIFQTISIPLIDNQLYNGTLQFKVNLSNPAGAPLTTGTTQTVSIVDDEVPPTLALQPATSVQEGDSGQVDVPITVKLTGATELPVTANWSWNEGPYGPFHTGMLQFAPGETQKTLPVSYTANTTPEPDRTITLRLFDPTNATIPVSQTAITIVDDDFAGVSIADASIVESAGKAVVPIQLSCVSLKPFTITYETRNGTALAGSDYVATSGTFTLGSGGLSISIPIVNDTLREDVKAFYVVITSITGGKLDRGTATVTIVDDDTAAPAPAPPRRRLAPH